MLLAPLVGIPLGILIATGSGGLIRIPLLVKLLERGDEGVVGFQVVGRGYFLGGFQAGLDEGVQCSEEIGVILDIEIEFAGFLEGKDREIAGTRDDAGVIEADELGVDHARGEIDLDGGLRGDAVDGAVVDVVPDVGFPGEEDGGLHAAMGGGDNGASDIVVAEVSHFDVERGLGGVEGCE